MQTYIVVIIIILVVVFIAFQAVSFMNLKRGLDAMKANSASTKTEQDPETAREEADKE